MCCKSWRLCRTYRTLLLLASEEAAEALAGRGLALRLLPRRRPGAGGLLLSWLSGLLLPRGAIRKTRGALVGLLTRVGLLLLPWGELLLLLGRDLLLLLLLLLLRRVSR